MKSIIIIGYMGAGKTTVALDLGRRLGNDVVSLFLP